MELYVPMTTLGNRETAQSATAATADPVVTVAPSQTAKKKSSDKYPKLSKLHSCLKFIKATIKSQCTRLGTTMVNGLKAILVMEYKICSWRKTL